MKGARIHLRERSGLALVEEAVALLRGAPLSVHAAYLIGSFPFVVALLFFWTDMSRGAFARERLAAGSLGLALLYGWMKLWQARHAAGLRAHLESAPVAPMTFPRGVGVAAQQTLIHGIGLFLLPLALILVIPFAWVYAFLQNCSVYGDWDHDGLRPTLRRAWRQAMYWPLQNHYVVWMGSPVLMMLACAALLVTVPLVSQVVTDPALILAPLILLLLLLMSPISILVAVNLFLIILLVPTLLHMLFGIDTVFSRGLTGLFNSTTLATTAGLTYIVLDPLMKAVYVLRCFHAESIASGADIRSSLARAASRLVTAAVVLGAVLLMPSPVAAAEPAALDRAIDTEIHRAEYAWRLPRDATMPPGADTWLEQWVQHIGERLQSVLAIVYERADRIIGWLRRLFPDGPSDHATGWRVAWDIVLRCLLVGAAVLLVAAVTVTILRFVRTRRGAARAGALGTQEPVAPDPEDEQVTADALPEDEWMALARQLVANGEYRPAIRACFLAALSHLSQRELVQIRAYKSNRDYLRELERRTHTHPDLPAAFRHGITAFECVWYGSREPTPARFDELAATLHRIKAS